jgi:hypothetical protein
VEDYGDGRNGWLAGLSVGPECGGGGVFDGLSAF